MSLEWAPWTRGIMNCLAAPGVVMGILRKPAQMAGTEAIRSYVGWRVDQDPCPMAVGFPNRTKLREVFLEDVLPMFRDTGPLADLMTSRKRDQTSERIRLKNSVVIQGMWSGSAASLATHPFGVVHLSEVDKFGEAAGIEADPIGQAVVRTRTFGSRGRVILESTPTDIYHPITTYFDAAHYRLFYYVPCPHCGGLIQLVFGQLKWPDCGTEDRKARATQILNGRLCWYECQLCGKRIEDSQKKAMVNAGRWRTEDGSIEDAEKVAAWPDDTRLGFQLSVIYCLWPGFHWAKVAAQFLEAIGDRDKMLNFRTLWLGLPAEETALRQPANVFAAKSARGETPPGVMPTWASVLLASVDTQADGFYLVIRAYGAWPRSQRIFHRWCRTFEELDQLCYRTFWRVENDAFRPQRCRLTFIDTGGTDTGEGSRTMQVYNWARPRRRWVVPLKGASRDLGTLLLKPAKGWIDRGRTKKSSKSIPIFLYDKKHFHDQLAELIAQDDPEVWLLDNQDDPVYDDHMGNLVKNVRYRGNRLEYQWMEVAPGTRHDYRDCEAMQLVGAFYYGLEQQTDEGVHQFQRAEQVLATGQTRPADAKGKPESAPRPQPGGGWNPGSWADLLGR